MLAQALELLLTGSWNRWKALRSVRTSSATTPAPSEEAIVMGQTIPFWSEPRDIVSIPQRLRPLHLTFSGSTGTGKTTALRHLLRADIAANRSIFLLDMQGDLADGALKTLASLKSPQEVAGRLLYMDLRDPRWIVPFNVLQPSGPYEDAFTRALTLVDALRALNESWGTQLHETCLVSLAALAEAGLSVLELEELLSEQSPLRARVVACTGSDYVRTFFRDRFEPLSPDRKAALRTPVLNKLPFLAIPDLRLLLGQPQGFTFSLFDERPGLIVIVALDGARLQEAARLTAALLVASLVNYVLGRSRQTAGERSFLSIVLDEAQNFASSRFETLLAEGRRYNVSLNLAHQHLHQLPAGLSHALRNNAGHQFLFGCGSLDAPELARGVVIDVPDGEEAPDVREILLTQGVGQCLLTRRGQKSVHLQIAPCPEPHIAPARLGEYRAVANAEFARPRAELETKASVPATSSVSPSDKTPDIPADPKPEVRHGKRRSFAVPDKDVPPGGVIS